MRVCVSDQPATAVPKAWSNNTTTAICQRVQQQHTLKTCTHYSATVAHITTRSAQAEQTHKSTQHQTKPVHLPASDYGTGQIAHNDARSTHLHSTGLLTMQQTTVSS
jgi:hypothetical protein